MWKRFWRTWTVDKPGALGDWLWEILVLEFAALLDRLTLRQVVAFIPVVILIVAYAHSIPLPPELMLVGDLVAYIDIFSMIMLLSLLARAATILYVIRQAAEHIRECVSRACIRLRPDSRHRRLGGPVKRRRWIRPAKDDDDGRTPIYGMALA
jgi:hypothetical protein